jgi:hypothetical protein
MIVLKTDRNRIMQETQRIDEAIKRKQAQIEKINEKSFKTSIRTNMLGKDAARTEYWHFKEDCERVYIRKEEVTNDDGMQSTHVSWHYLDEDEKFDILVESMNAKGIRERKLLEGLKKCKDRLKLKKPKKMVLPLPQTTPTEDIVMTEVGDQA